MSCNHPRDVVLLTFSDGSRKVDFRKFPGLDLSDIQTLTGAVEVEPISLPCGKCLSCKLSHAREWAVRIMHESSFYRHNCFITLTYSNDFLPANGVLVKSHVQNFIKRLRARHPDLSIRYYLCGEYGGKSHRPHYHAIIFGYDFSLDRRLLFISNGFPVFRSVELESLWPFGISSVANLSFESAGYVARYILKNYKVSDEFRGFSIMSLKPGIGCRHFDVYSQDIINTDKVFYRKNGSIRSCKPPRYYDKLLQRSNPSAFEYLKAERLARIIDEPDPKACLLDGTDPTKQDKISFLRFKKLIRSLEDTY